MTARDVVRPIFSTLVDSTPKYEFQGLAWAWSLLLAGVPSEQIVVHHTPHPSRGFISIFADLGVEAKEVPPHPSGHLHCNKLQQLKHGTWSGADLVVLCDADLVWLDPHHLPRVQFAGKIVDRPNPPEDRWKEILGEAQLSALMVPVDVTKSPRERTPSTNLNGGLYLLDANLVIELAEAWDERVSWLGRREALLDRYTMHRDQVAMALALLDLGVTPVHLDRGWNFPTHLDPGILRRPIVHIRALHHHDRRNQSGKLLPVGVRWIDDAIKRANEGVDSMLSHFAAHPVFWDWRYRENPALGSGMGSRGDIAHIKREALAAAVAAHPDWSIVDLGCGDLEISHSLPVAEYLGLDTSAQALEIAATRRPDWRFADPYEIDDEDFRADVAICLDVLIHQDKDAADATVKWLSEHATRRIVISGFDEAPSPVSTVHFDRPLREMLAERFGPVPLFPLARYRGVTMYAVDVNDSPRTNPHDIDSAALSDVLPLVEHAHLLLELMDRSRSAFGFFPATVSRCIEYPWFLANLHDLTPTASILDLGAGVSALPLALADRGFAVTTVDSDEKIRDPSDTRGWNEWGFLDYSVLDSQVTSVHGPFESARLERQDAIISVSAIEHVPASIRLAMLNRAVDLLAPTGLLLLSMDLVPGSNHLWNLREGIQVEEPGDHGTVTTVLDELESLGFDVDSVETRTTIPGSRTDLALVRAYRRKADDGG
jgi:2-polyprenyl-3-methyl-5-hydroxy-6-metoxy-1,4-benzoquinol methylase